eukprot:2691197-Pyramimonas_sp.AAC.1
MVKIESQLSEDEARSLFESIQVEPVRHSRATRKVVTSLCTLGECEDRNNKTKIALTLTSTLDAAYAAILKNKEPQMLDGMHDVIS